MMADCCWMLYRDAPDWCSTERESRHIFNFCFSGTNDVVHTKFCFMSWKCAYVYDNFCEY